MVGNISVSDVQVRWESLDESYLKSKPIIKGRNDLKWPIKYHVTPA